jgi:rod shape determining protein RodA
MRLLRETDFLLLGAALLTVLLGITMIYSATFYSENEALKAAWQRQSFFALIALLLILGIVFIPNKVLYGLAYPLYGLSLLTLLMVLVWGSGSGDLAARWLVVGPVRLQPSELAKITTIIALAHYLADYSRERINSLGVFLGALLIPLVPMALVVRQPDLGTAISFGAPFFPMLYWAGMRRLYIFFVISPLFSVVFAFEQFFQTPFLFAAFIIISAVVVHFLLAKLWVTLTLLGVNLSAGLVTVYLWNSLLEYQKKRILILLNPDSDRLGDGWNIIQSKIAIGSGGLRGKGFLGGTQPELEFLPAAHTDFIFSVIGEELGFIGALVVLALFVFLIGRAFYIGSIVNSRFLSFVAIGLGSMLTFHVFVNIGMTIGVLPVTGLPLPFLSYGGSSLLANCIAIGLLMHIYTNRHEY